jgi:hypothetical protein
VCFREVASTLHVAQRGSRKKDNPNTCTRTGETYEKEERSVGTCASLNLQIDLGSVTSYAVSQTNGRGVIRLPIRCPPPSQAQNLGLGVANAWRQAAPSHGAAFCAECEFLVCDACLADEECLFVRVDAIACLHTS